MSNLFNNVLLVLNTPQDVIDLVSLIPKDTTHSGVLREAVDKKFKGYTNMPWYCELVPPKRIANLDTFVPTHVKDYITVTELAKSLLSDLGYETTLLEGDVL